MSTDGIHGYPAADVTGIILPTVYNDAVSVWHLPDGRLVNRWDPADYPRRHADTQAWIDAQEHQ